MLSTALLAAVPAQAGDATFSGAFTGSDPSTGAFPGACADAGNLAWQATDAFRVSAAGDYALADAGELAAVDVLIGVFEGAFTPGSPAANRLAVVDGGGVVALDSGQDYVLVAQRQCAGEPGAWAAALSGPGNITGPDAFPAPSWSVGTLGNGASQADFGDGAERFRNLGPLRVERSGTYTLSDVGVFTGLDAEARLYEGAFSAGNTESNLVAVIDDAGRAFLEAGTDYRMVVTGFHPGDTGDFRLQLLPPGSMAINEGLSGAWFERATSGQGLVIEIYPERRLVFVAWFTFDVAAPFDPDEATLGDASQRWLTALGTYAEGADSVTLTVSNTSGGRFDMRDPGQDQDNAYGTLTLTFQDCATATLDYDLPAAQAVGQIPLQRVADDNVRTCGERLPGPGAVSD